jgi:hypothetical protein
MTRRPIVVLVVLLGLALPAPGLAQEAAEPASEDEAARDEARRLLDEAQAHSDAGRHALAAETYLQMYDVMHRASLPRASIALFSAGRALAQVPGHEREARDTLQRFLRESTTLTDDAQVRDWRSDAVEQITELEARAPDESAEETPAEAEAVEAPLPREESPSPLGPIVMGVGGATLLAGVIVGAFSLSMDAEFRDACGDLTMCPTALRPQYDEMRAFSAAADVLMVAGGVVAVLGLVLTLTISNGDQREPDVVVSGTCTGDGCLTAARGRF